MSFKACYREGYDHGSRIRRTVEAAEARMGIN